MGYIHGKPLIDDPRWDTGKTHVYQWSIESGEYATLVFEVTDYSIGIEKLQSVETVRACWMDESMKKGYLR